MTAPLTPADLFNCCTNYAEPKWADFTRIEIGGCVMSASLGEEVVQGGVAFASAKFFTIYGREHDGTALAITDCPDALTALRVAAHLWAVSGLPFTFYASEG